MVACFLTDALLELLSARGQLRAVPNGLLHDVEEYLRHEAAKPGPTRLEYAAYLFSSAPPMRGSSCRSEPSDECVSSVPMVLKG